MSDTNNTKEKKNEVKAIKKHATSPVLDDQISSEVEKNPDCVENLSCPEYYFNRDVNWLDFNLKVLNEALDTSNPLLEQVKFLAIYHNNLDEYFMVRVANVFLQYLNNVDSIGPDQTKPVKQLALIRKAVLEHLNKGYTHWNNYIVKQLAEKNIHIKKYSSLTKRQKKFVANYFHTEIYPVLTPQAIDPTHPMPIISNLSLNFIVKIEGDATQDLYARLKCPNNLPRFIMVPRQKDYEEFEDYDGGSGLRDCDIIMQEDIIRAHMQDLFVGFKVMDVSLFRITRNTDIKLEEDEAHDLLRTVQDMIDQRRFGDVVRLEVHNGISSELLQFLTRKLMLRSTQIYKIKGILAFSEMFALSGLDKPNLLYPPYKRYTKIPFREENVDTVFDYLRHNDVFLHLPYDSFTPIQEFLNKASVDPQVVAIKQTLYRTGKNSPIVQALMEARRQGKQVTAVVELKARFDEEQNITWAEELEKAGVHVVYGLPGMKIHAKLCLVVRKEGTKVNRYVHIGTGNYNPSTAKIYTDMGIITSNVDICSDVSDLFNVMTGYAKKDKYREIFVSPSSSRKEILKLIDEEIASHKKHGNGQIFIKCNQLVDEKSIQKLYRASQAGVKIKLQVRGVCCLRPNIPKISENIEVTSIVGRFLEHSRIFCFYNNGTPKISIGSADLMQRNLDRRIEVITPVLDQKISNYIYNTIILEYFREDSNAYYLHNDGTYARKTIDGKPLANYVNVQSELIKKGGKR